MFSILHDYFFNVAYGNLRKVVSFELLFSFFVAFFLAISPYKPEIKIKEDIFSIVDLAGLLRTYGAFGFGVCMTTLTFATRINVSGFSEHMWNQDAKTDSIQDFPLLIFKLSWTALVHWFALLFSSITCVFAAEDWFFPNPDNSVLVSILGGGLVFLFCYCALLSLTVLLSIATLCLFRTDFQEKKDAEGQF